ETEHQHPRRKRVERTRMADAPLLAPPAHALDNIMAGQQPFISSRCSGGGCIEGGCIGQARLIDDQDAMYIWICFRTCHMDDRSFSNRLGLHSLLRGLLAPRLLQI